MGSRILSAILVLASFAAVASSAQTNPAAIGPYRNQVPFTIGGGASNLNVDWGHNRMYGYTVWVDWRPTNLPKVLDGLGIEIQGRDVNFGRGPTLPSVFRQDTLGGGPIYTYRRYPLVQPYGKFLIEYGRLNAGGFGVLTNKVYAPSFGLQVHAIRNVWVRAEYEYQVWPNLLGGQIDSYKGKSLDPQGFTLGVSYDFHSVLRFR